MSAMRTRRWIVVIGFSLFLIIFAKNAWVTEDAYITFRSIEQVFAGNGPRWNPHERVQAFTSPLWFWVVAFFRLFSPDVFGNAILISALCCIMLLLVLWMSSGDPLQWLSAVLLLLCSNAFFDYTSSGLENVLGFLLLTSYMYFYQKFFTDLALQPRQQKQLFFYILLTACGMLLVRHDLSTLIVIPTILVWWKSARMLARRTRWRLAGTALLPFCGWSGFALLYYGAIFPNTAYAKLYTGIDKWVLAQKGLHYLLRSLQYDTITMIVITAAVILFIMNSKLHIKCLGSGICLNVAYIVYVGGDFMQGRFVSYAYLLAVIGFLSLGPLAAHCLPGLLARRLKYAVLCLYIGYMVLYPHTPMKSSWDYENTVCSADVCDERGMYFATSSLWQYLVNNTEPYFPQHVWSSLGYSFAQSPDKVFAVRAVGYLGYWAGTEKIIIDNLALSDPFLARLPMTTGAAWSIGHYPRFFPPGYLESVQHQSAEIADPDLNTFYQKITAITQSQSLWSWERIKTILELNMGHYQHYTEAYRKYTKAQ